MGVRDAFAAAIARVGAPVQLLRGDAVIGSFPASLQPRSMGEPVSDRVGWHLPRQLVLYAPCGSDGDLMRPGDTIAANGHGYYIQSVEQALFGGKGVYYKAYLLPGEDENE